MNLDITSTQALPAGTCIEEFVIERVLGAGGFGITYLAQDTNLDRRVVIKENLPVQFCFRDPGSMNVAPRHTTGEDVENFKWSLENFAKEAAMLASLDHPGIVKVLRSFQAFGTAYFVMPFVEGVALDDLISQRRKEGQVFTEEELLDLLERTLSALDHLHDRGIYHRDIKPGNLLITNDGVPVLIDFGSARQRLSERSMTVLESAGYTPFEQLQSRGNVGPWSDLYAFGGTLCKALTGEAPPKANDRAFDDPFIPLAERQELASRYSQEFLSSIDKALASRIAERWQNAGEWKKALMSGAVVGMKQARTAPKPLTDESLSPPLPAAKGKRWAWVVVALVILSCSVWLAKGSRGASKPGSKDATVVLPGGLVITSEPSGALVKNAAGEERDFEIAPGVKMTMCWIPPGEFMMGSPAGELGRYGDEDQHRVRITKAFWLAKTETTQAQWRAVMGNNPSLFKGDNLPVEGVSWNDIAGPGGFIEKANKATAVGEGGFSLPTEAQWEYACRAGETGLYSGGTLDQVAWYDGNSGDKTHPVGSKKPNAWGLHDMHGNVWEWCADWYGDELSGGIDPQGASTGVNRVYRGGSWYDGAASCRAAGRLGYYPALYFFLGFRPALVPSEKQDK